MGDQVVMSKTNGQLAIANDPRAKELAEQLRFEAEGKVEYIHRLLKAEADLDKLTRMLELAMAALKMIEQTTGNDKFVAWNSLAEIEKVREMTRTTGEAWSSD